MKKHLVILCASLLSFIIIYKIKNISYALPGSDDDPVVSKSYVDQKFDQIMELVNNTNSPNVSNVSNVLSQEQFEKLSTQVMEEFYLLLRDKDKKNDTYIPIKLNKGESLIGKEGTQIIARAGELKAISQGLEGLVNLTTGNDIFDNSIIKKNNLIVIPRDDGRGVIAGSDSWLLVKGDYMLLR